jgi:hypothetical protein
MVRLTPNQRDALKILNDAGPGFHFMSDSHRSALTGLHKRGFVKVRFGSDDDGQGARRTFATTDDGRDALDALT